MILKFVWWFICYGLSFCISNIGWTDQGRAFLILYLGLRFALVMWYVIIKKRFSWLGTTVLVVAIILSATWVATQLFEIDFFVAYQIMTFGQCLCNNKD